MKTNYKKEAEKWENKYWEKHNRFSPVEFFVGVVMAIFFTLFFLFMFHAFDSPLNELDIDKDKLAKDYVIGLYPEFEMCSFEYNFCVKSQALSSCEAGVKVYCNDLGNRNGLKISNDVATEIILFEGITLEEIFENKINEYSIK